VQIGKRNAYLHTKMIRSGRAKISIVVALDEGRTLDTSVSQNGAVRLEEFLQWLGISGGRPVTLRMSASINFYH